MLDIVLRLLAAVGPATAALPEFLELVENVKDALDSKSDQNDLQEAYELAVQNRQEAVDELRDLVARKTGG